MEENNDYRKGRIIILLVITQLWLGILPAQDLEDIYESFILGDARDVRYQDGYIYVLGQRSEFTGGTTYWPKLTKIAPVGTISWQVDLQFATEPDLRQLSFDLYEDKLYVLGTRLDGGTYSGYFVAVINAVSGEGESYTEEDLALITASIRVDATGIYITGTNPNQSRLTTLKYDLDQGAVWSYTATNPNTGGVDLLSLPGDGGIVGVGGEEELICYQLDGAGQLVWISTIEYSKPLVAEQILRADDGRLYVVGFSAEGIDAQVFVAEISSSGELLWLQEYGGSNYDYNTVSLLRGDRIHILFEENLLGPSSAKLYAIDRFTRALLCVQDYADGIPPPPNTWRKMDRPAGFQMGEDGTFVMLLERLTEQDMYSSPVSWSYLIKEEVPTCLDGVTSVSDPRLASEAIRIFQQDASGFTVAAAFNAEVSIDLYNLLGQRLYAVTRYLPEETENRVVVPELPAGTYLVVVQAKSGEQRSTVIVLQP